MSMPVSDAAPVLEFIGVGQFQIEENQEADHDNARQGSGA